MSNRFAAALVLSGALHAGLLATASGLHPWLLTGLGRDPTETLTVSIRGIPGKPQGAKRVHRARRPTSQAATIPDSNPPSPKRMPDQNKVVHDIAGRQQPVKTALPVTVPRTEPERIGAKAKHEVDETTAEAVDAEPSPAHRPAGPDQSASIAGARPASNDRKSDGDSGAAAERTYLAEFLAALSRYKHYPQSARLRREEGRVVVALILKHDGTIKDVQIKEPSRFPLLDRAALRSVRELDRFKPFPAGMDRSAWQLSVPFQYAIRDQ